MSSSGEVFGVSDAAILIYTWIFYSVLCQIINIFGIVTNIINIICFAKQGFEDSVNISLLGLAISDLGNLLTMVWTCVCVTPAVATADLPFDPMEVMYLTSIMTHFSFTRVSGCITAMITLERCLCITAPLKIKSIITPQRSTVITVCIFIIFFCSGAPIYTVNRLGMTFSPLRNRTLFGLISSGDKETTEMFSFGINNFVIPFGAFMMIIVCTIILSIKLQKSSQWRAKSTNSTQIDTTTRRNRKAATMVVMISTLFIVCFIPVSIGSLTLAFVPELALNGKYFKISIMIGGFAYVMESVNSSMNIFIYIHMSSKYRNIFRQIFCKKLEH